MIEPAGKLFCGFFILIIIFAVKLYLMNPKYPIDQIPIFFIVGRGRSGSTLLRTLFDAHPDVCIPLESRFVQYLYYRYNSVTNWNIELVEQLLEEIAKGFEPLDIDKENVFSFVESYQGNLDFGIVCKILYLSIHSEYKKSEILYIGDKNPRYSFFIPQLLEIFSDARFIHLVRDYRDHLVSVKRSFKKIKDSAYTPFIIARWIYYNKQLEKQKKKFPDKFYTLRFEDLIATPESSLKDLCKFLDLGYNPKMLEYSSGLKGYYKDDNFNDLHKSLQHPFNISKIGESSKQLTKVQLFFAEALAGKFGAKYGYSEKTSKYKLLKYVVKLLCLPIMFYGSLRYRLKVFIYPSFNAMKLIHIFLLKIR